MKSVFQTVLYTGFFLASAGILSCSKKQDEVGIPEPPAYTTEKWAGQICMGNGPVFYDIAVELKSDHTVKITEGNAIANGTWSNSGNLILANYTFKINGTGEYSFLCIPSVDGKTMNGTWGVLKATFGEGTILMRRQ